MTEMNKSLRWRFARPVQSIKYTSGYFMVIFIISSVAYETSRTNFVPLSNVNSVRSESISRQTDSLALSLVVTGGRPLGRE
jgi:hypothetical protein